MNQGGQVYYIHGDHLGSTNVVCGAAISRQTYYAYGLPRTSEGTLPTDYAFTGQRQDASDGLLYYGARYYEASLNRWTQPDTIIPDLYNPQDLNRYTYTRNNPVEYTDPSGHAACIDEECDLLQNPTNDDVIVSNASNPVYRLILEISQGNTSAAHSLNRALAETSGTGMSPLGDNPLGSLSHTNFRGLGALKGGRGFTNELDDDHLYGQPGWGGRTGVSQQLGHFLTAVNMGYSGSEALKRAIVGHEQVSDRAALAPLRAFSASDADVAAFNWGIVNDMQGDFAARDAQFASILDHPLPGMPSDRVGNSMEDLRLSARGWELGRGVALGDLTTNRDIVIWLLHNIAGY